MKFRNTIAAIGAIVLFAISSPSQSSGPLVTVFKTPTCSCCGKWVEHLKANGFTVKVQEVNSTAASERQYRVPRNMESCHTAVVDGYTIEGHVPATEIKRLLNERPKLLGLAVPGMPLEALQEWRARIVTPTPFSVSMRKVTRPCTHGIRAGSARAGK